MTEVIGGKNGGKANCHSRETYARSTERIFPHEKS